MLWSIAGVVVATACGVLPPEEQLLTDFFEASRVYDTAVMSRLSAVPMNPRSDGIVDSFDIARVDRAADGGEQVTITAHVRMFDGHVTTRRLVFTLVHTERWFIKDWRSGQEERR